MDVELFSMDNEMKLRTDKLPFGFTTIGVINLAGGSGVVARACGISIQSVTKWRYIPGRHARTVAIAAGLPLSIVRPDMVVAE
jgi:hypothetical protein